VRNSHQHVTVETFCELRSCARDDGSLVSHDGDCVTAPERAGLWPLPGERTCAATS
jgi:hypothetical protein